MKPELFSIAKELSKSALTGLSNQELTSLRCLAEIRTAVHQKIETSLIKGQDRCCEDTWQEFGLVRSSKFLRMYNGLTDAARELLDDDLCHLAADLVMINFPREDDGRLPVNSVVLLATYDYQFPQSRDRQMWLVASGPKLRRDPQVVTLSLDSLIGINHPHRWDQARWFWDVRQQSASEELRWGVTGLSLDTLGLQQHVDHVNFLAERCIQPDPSIADRASLCILLQDEGRIEEAFLLFDTELTPDVLKILHGQPLSIHAYDKEESWKAMMLKELCHAAPWRFASALKTEKRLRLFCLPHQTQQSKASLMLTVANKHQRKLQLEIEWTASNKRLAEIVWRRPVELDLKRI